MNRIILIGNGFDLAHGMLTSYNDFLNDYWENTIKEVQNSDKKERFENEEIIVENVPSMWLPGYSYINFIKSLDNAKSTLTYKNTFLKLITKKSYLQNWVDIENEYYSQLKRGLDNPSPDNNNIDKLNSDFYKIKELLRKHLIRVEDRFDKTYRTNCIRIISNIGQKIYSPFKLKDFSEEALIKKAELEFENLKDSIEKVTVNRDVLNTLPVMEKRVISRIGTEDPFNRIKKVLQSEAAINYFDLIPNETLFLNFNYTFSELLYNKPEDFDNDYDNKNTIPKFIHIHGTTDKARNNPIIFGFGDELDDDYKSIEKLNDNRYLENIKSIKYLETDNYKKLLEFINNDIFQIFIMGHSCGISDRTLLNTIFEHNNCASIKIFYHQIEKNVDNYSDIVKNISRNFNNKAIMRDKVVNKTYCEQLF